VTSAAAAICASAGSGTNRGGPPGASPTVAMKIRDISANRSVTSVDSCAMRSASASDSG
jgi:hypothetical protein